MLTLTVDHVAHRFPGVAEASILAVSTCVLFLLFLLLLLLLLFLFLVVVVLVLPKGLATRSWLACLVLTLLAPLIPLIQLIYGMIMDRISRKHASARFGPLWAKAQGGTGAEAGEGSGSGVGPSAVRRKS